MNGPTDLGSAGGEGVGSGAARVEPAASTPALNSRPSVLPTGLAGAAATASVGHAPTCPLVCCTSADDEAVTGVPAPYTEAEFEALIGSIWNFAPDPEEEDLTRFDELLTAALAFIGLVALKPDTDPYDAMRATALLRSMEQRALWGPDHPVRQP